MACFTFPFLVHNFHAQRSNCITTTLLCRRILRSAPLNCSPVLCRQSSFPAATPSLLKVKMTTMSTDERFALVRSVGEECIKESELRELLEKKPQIRCYDGFEPSGRLHIAQGIFKAINVNKCTQGGCEFVFWVADWFALMNDKVGGELEKIQVVGKYLIEAWKAAGMDMSKVTFLWSSEEITKHAAEYWKIVLDIGRQNTIARIKKCCTIMGKAEGTLTGAQILYPLMQCTDVFFLKADICQLGVDQRKVNMLAREYCDQSGRKRKPVILSHHMLAGLKKGQAKMSKSDPDSAIFMEDSVEDVSRKIMQAYCPQVAQKEAVVTDDGAPECDEDKNPVLDYYQCIIFSVPNAEISINGKSYSSYEALEKSFIDGLLSEEDLKRALINEINERLNPVRRHFSENDAARELFEQVKSFRNAVSTQGAKETVEKKAITPLLCAWLPAVIKLSLDTALAYVSSFKQFLSEHPDGKGVLVLPNWTAFACNEITGDEKDINAALQFNAKLLATRGLPASVEVVLESDFILAQPNDFWVTAIHVGRGNSLSQIEQVYNNDLKLGGQVVGILMRAATATVMNATHIIGTNDDAKKNEFVHSYSSGTIECLPVHENTILPLHRPDVTVVGPDDILCLDDNDMDVRRKIKKAYCAEKEGANPVVSIGVHIINTTGGLTVERGEQHGGNVTYSSETQLREDCASGALHPGDLKAAVTKVMVELSADTRTLLGSAEVKKLSQTLRNAEKKLLKKK